ncbi:MAG TPA: hypothetical protein VFO55_13660 [Gemmatimonadaceae bacterium]|nr:hypothetical protein [Gemmatimonadaceae bacterium]
MLSPRRLFFGTSTALVLAALLATLAVSSRAVRVSAANRAAAAASRLETRMARGDDSTRAISLAYLERARLGMGSPFRLIDQAIGDPRLDDSLRLDIAWTIVGRILDHRVYHVDPRALDPVDNPAASAGHLELIEDVISGASEPRVAEAAVRIAYGLASANGTTGLTSLPVIAEVAAQVRDRALAVRDLRAAIPRAVNDGVDLVDELIHLRATRELKVEQPLMGQLTYWQRQEAIDAAPAILRRIESVARVQAPEPLVTTLLDHASARALARIAPRLPPLGAARVVVTGRAGTLRADSALDRNAIGVISSAANEESLIAANAYADRSTEGRATSLARLMVSVGVALRAHAQDRVWFPGDAAPSAGSVIGRFALKSISFERGIPAAWRPFYTQMIAQALDDFIRVVPSYDPAGLSFHIALKSLPDSALAMHDPRSHTIRLSAMTPSGTLAHELAHDVDWRAGRLLFAKSGGYATDRSLRESEMRLTSSMRGLTSARIVGRGRISPHGSARPAEVFARSVDWLVTDALAERGISNGYLSAIQDPVIAGFAAIPSDAAALDGAGALVRSLAEMTWVPDSVAEGYTGRWESLDRLDPSTVVMRVLDAPMAIRRLGRAPFGIPSSMMTDLFSAGLCRVDAMRDGSAQERLIAMTIEARARGILVRRARSTAAAARPAWARALLGDPMAAPRSADEMTRRTIASVAEGVARAGLLDLPPAPFRPRCD